MRFVIFDELYSGTNHEQAVKSAYSYLKYLGEFKNKLMQCQIIKKCNNCGYKNKNVTSKKLLKIHWIGKYGGNILCEQCVFDKDYRINNR